MMRVWCVFRPRKQAYVECFCHSKVLGLLSGEALVRGVASISQPCLLLKTLNALLGLFWGQRRYSHGHPSPIATWGRSADIHCSPRCKSSHWPSERGSPQTGVTAATLNLPQSLSEQKEASLTPAKEQVTPKETAGRPPGNTPYRPLICTPGHFLCINI